MAPFAEAQVGETRVSIVVSPTLVDFAGFGPMTSVAAEVRVTRFFSEAAGGQLSTFAVVPLEGAAALSACAPGRVCESRSTPGLVSGAVMSMIGEFGETGFRGSFGPGYVSASGMQGSGPRSTAAVAFGLDWIPSGRSRFTPTLGLRIVQMTSAIAGMRQLVLPGVGLTF